MTKTKNNILIRLGNAISFIGYSYQYGGLKIVWYSIKYGIYYKIVRFKYRHSKKFKNKLIENNYKSPKVAEAIFDNMFNDKPIDLKQIYNDLTDKEKEKFKQTRDECLKKTIEEYNITDEEQIKQIRDKLNFD